MPERQWTCQGCGNTGVQTTPGKLRKWCSERCRKSQYDLVCVDCGGRVSGTDPGRQVDRDNPVCGTCSRTHYATWTRDAIVLCVQEWADEHGGVPPTARDFDRARAVGAPVPVPNHVKGRFGSWNAAIIASGFQPHACGPVGGFSYLAPEQRAEAARRYAAGESSNRIAADLRCSPITVLKWARHHGVPIRPSFSARSAA